MDDFEDKGSVGVGRSRERREKSLGLLSQRFIQMFLVAAGDKVVALEGAAQMLLGTHPTAHTPVSRKLPPLTCIAQKDHVHSGKHLHQSARAQIMLNESSSSWCAWPAHC